MTITAPQPVETSTQSHHGTLATMEAFIQQVQPQLA